MKRVFPKQHYTVNMLSYHPCWKHAQIKTGIPLLQCCRVETSKHLGNHTPIRWVCTGILYISVFSKTLSLFLRRISVSHPNHSQIIVQFQVLWVGQKGWNRWISFCFPKRWPWCDICVFFGCFSFGQNARQKIGNPRIIWTCFFLGPMYLPKIDHQPLTTNDIVLW